MSLISLNTQKEESSLWISWKVTSDEYAEITMLKKHRYRFKLFQVTMWNEAELVDVMAPLEPSLEEEEEEEEE